MIRPLSLILLCTTAIASLQAERVVQELSSGWKFIKQDVELTASSDSWECVTVPHTWNALDGQLGQPILPNGLPAATPEATAAPETPEPNPTAKPLKLSNYYRGIGWYERTLNLPAEWAGRRVFIRFEAACQVATVYLNGQLLGEHQGAFTAFCYELTPHLHFEGRNELRVQVNNTRRKDIPPLSGDFNMDGGIYRPVQLIVTDAVCVSPLDFASPGVYLTPKTTNPNSASVEVRSIVSNGLNVPASVKVGAKVFDAKGRPVAGQQEPVTLAANETKAITQTIVLPHPHLWNGRKDAYVYTSHVDIVRADHAVDSVTQPLGLRTVAITQDKGFLLNGEPYPIHGVNRHQERRDQGWALSPADHREDAQMILDMGATAVRLAHYPQSNYWHDLCDHNGLILWDELSLIGVIEEIPPFTASAEGQLREMILQLYNHPSICFWSLFNELADKPEPTPAQIAVVQRMKDLAVELDSSRLIAAASCHKNIPYNLIPEAICFNSYPGWYTGATDDMTSVIAGYSAEVGKRIGISEYGAGGNPAQHLEGPPEHPISEGKSVTNGPFHPEEWQSHVHESVYAQMKNNPNLWGTFVWAMFDFASSKRKEGGLVAVNDKGLVSQDRKLKKDAYFFYQANWSTTPMVYLASHRATPRHEATTEVRVYSNCSNVELTLNGKSLGSAKPDSVNVFQWSKVKLQPGDNRLEAVAHSGKASLKDSCVWNLQGLENK